MRIDSLRPCVNGVEHDESGVYPHDPDGNCRECVFEADQKQHQRVQELVELMRKGDRRTNEKYGSIHWFYAVAEYMIDRLPRQNPSVTAEQVEIAARSMAGPVLWDAEWSPTLDQESTIAGADGPVFLTGEQSRERFREQHRNTVRANLAAMGIEVEQ